MRASFAVAAALLAACAQAQEKLAPHPARMSVTPASEIPIEKLKLPNHFKVEIWASGLPGARAMALSDDGRKVWVGTRAIGRVYEVSDEGGKRRVRVLAEKLTQPAGVAYHQGALYVFAIDKVLRYDGIAGNPKAAPQDLTAKFDLPPEQHHNWKYVAFGPDGKLYVPFGAPCNICEPGKEYAQIRRYNADGSGMEVIARGVRNSVGFDWHPRTRQLWFTDHGRDWMGDSGPQDELNRLTSLGQNFGFPYCHANGLPDNEVKKADPCKGVTRPEALLGPHAAAMGVKFYTGGMFPAAYRNTLFIARKGSWNRTKPFGFDVVNVRFGDNGRAIVRPFITGFNEDRESYKFWGRPAYLAQLPDGSLLLSDEHAGALYRISYSK